MAWRGGLVWQGFQKQLQCHTYSRPAHSCWYSAGRFGTARLTDIAKNWVWPMLRNKLLLPPPEDDAAAAAAPRAEVAAAIAAAAAATVPARWSKSVPGTLTWAACKVHVCAYICVNGSATTDTSRWLVLQDRTLQQTHAQWKAAMQACQAIYTIDGMCATVLHECAANFRMFAVLNNKAAWNACNMRRAMCCVLNQVAPAKWQLVGLSCRLRLGRQHQAR